VSIEDKLAKEARMAPAAANSKIPMRALLAGARRKQASLIAFARQLVQAESPSDDKAAVDACLALAAARGKQLGSTQFGPLAHSGPCPAV
jgi:hypothetical protein